MLLFIYIGGMPLNRNNNSRRSALLLALLRVTFKSLRHVQLTLLMVLAISMTVATITKQWTLIIQADIAYVRMLQSIEFTFHFVLKIVSFCIVLH